MIRRLAILILAFAASLSAAAAQGVPQGFRTPADLAGIDVETRVDYRGSQTPLAEFLTSGSALECVHPLR